MVYAIALKTLKLARIFLWSNWYVCITAMGQESGRCLEGLHSKPIRGGKGGIPPLEARRATLPLEGKCTPPPKIGPTHPQEFW